MSETSIEHHRFRITTEDGVELEAELAAPASGELSSPTGVVVACHPHPLYGGSMHANVVEALFQSLPPTGAAVVRFNFRGAGSSTGSHDEGRAERLDVEAAVSTAVERWPDTPLLLAGYSFGADVALTVTDPSIGGWLAVAPPLRIVDRASMGALTDERPKTMITGTADQFNPYDELAATVAELPNTTVAPAAGADHFFAVGLDAVVAAANTALARLV
jgi:alpha/beta superfamily hydrolase